jgi:hypothetical protein
MRYHMGLIDNSQGDSIPAEKLLERKDYPNNEVKRMPKMTKIPVLTQ